MELSVCKDNSQRKTTVDMTCSQWYLVNLNQCRDMIIYHYIIVKIKLLILLLSSGKLWRRPTLTAASMPSMELLGNLMLGHRALKIWKSGYLFTTVCGREDRWMVLDWIVSCSCIHIVLSSLFHLCIRAVIGIFKMCIFYIYLSKSLSL